MRRPTLTLARLMLVIIGLAVGLAALRYATPLWADLLLCLTLGLLLTAPAGVLYRRGPRRAGWLGFGLFAGAYALVVFGPWTAELNDRLPSSQWLVVLDEIWPSPREHQLEQEIALAEAELARARDRKAWSDRMFKIGYISETQNIEDSYDLQRAELRSRQARQKRDVLKFHIKGERSEDASDETEPGPIGQWWAASTALRAPGSMERVGHSLATILVGLVGMGVFRWFQATEGSDPGRAGDAEAKR